MAWHKGPMPKGTYGFGGVVTAFDVASGTWRLAEFRGDHVLLPDAQNGVYLTGGRVEGAEVLWYNNSVTQPPAEAKQPAANVGPRPVHKS